MAYLAAGQTLPKAVGDASDPASALAVDVDADEAAQQASAEAAAWAPAEAPDETAPAAALLGADAAVETPAAAAPLLTSPDLKAVCVVQACHRTPLDQVPSHHPAAADAAGVFWMQLLCHVEAHTHRVSGQLGHQQGRLTCLMHWQTVLTHQSTRWQLCW